MMLFSVGHLENELLVWGLHYMGGASRVLDSQLSVSRPHSPYLLFFVTKPSDYDQGLRGSLEQREALYKLRAMRWVRYI